LRGHVYVLDQSLDSQPIHDAGLDCQGRSCSYKGFVPTDGHTYAIYFVCEGVSQGVHFGDWTETSLVMEPAVYVRGLPDPLNLGQQPLDGWPVTVIAGTTEDLGRLTADLSLNRAGNGAPVNGITVVFSVDIRGAGQQAATLKVDFPIDIAPGQYEGTLNFSTERQPTGVRLPRSVRVFRNVATPTAVIDSKDVDFGKANFEISGEPVKAQADLPISFRNGDPFAVQVTEFNSANCPGLQLTAGAPTSEGKLPLRLFTTGQTQLLPGVCTGTFALAAPDANSTVEKGTNLTWKLEIAPLAWAFKGVRGFDGREGQDFRAGDIGLPQERARGELLVYFTGNPNFRLEASDLHAGGGVSSIGAESLELLFGEPKAGTEENTYLVPVDLVVKESINYHPLWGTTYSGDFKLAVAGLPGKPVSVSFRFRSPSWLQRHFFKYYRLWWPGIVSWPLTLLFLLVVTFVMLRQRASRIEKQVAAQPEASPNPPESSKPSFPAPPPPSSPPWSVKPSTPSPFGRYSSTSPDRPPAPFSGPRSTGSASPLGGSSAPTSFSGAPVPGFGSQSSKPGPGKSSASTSPFGEAKSGLAKPSKPPWR
jgi:hypothetical protein